MKYCLRNRLYISLKTETERTDIRIGCKKAKEKEKNNPKIGSILYR